MTKFITPRAARVAAGLLVASAFAAVPMVAQAAPATTQAIGTLSAGSLSNTAPSIGSLSTQLTGVAQTVNAVVGAWNVTDSSGSNAGYTITVQASTPTDNSADDGTGTVLSPGTGGSMTLTPTAATVTAGNTAPTGPVEGAGLANSATPLVISGGAVTTDNAAAGTGQGSWDFAGAGNLAVVIPSDASAGFYSSTLTYTSAPLT